MQGPLTQPVASTPLPEKSLRRAHMIAFDSSPSARYVPGEMSTPTSKIPSPNDEWTRRVCDLPSGAGSSDVDSPLQFWYRSTKETLRVTDG